MNKYQSYKPSGVEWIGDIPEHWDTFRLGIIGVFSSSGIDKKFDENESKVRMVNYTDIIKSRIHNPVINNQIDFMVVTTTQSKLEEHRLKKGDLVFIPSSETNEDLGLSSLIDFDDIDIVYSYHILRFKFLKEVNHYFKKYLGNHYGIYRQFSSEGKGTTRQIIGRNVFRNVVVVLPTLKEQNQIVKFLDEKTDLIDRLIKTKDRKITLLKEQRTSLINQVVTKGLNLNVKMKDSGIEWIGDIPEHWEIKPLFTQCFNTKRKNNKIPLPILSLSYGKIKVRNIESNFGLLPESFDDYQTIEIGDVILRLTDLQNDKTSLRVGYSELKGLITPVYISLGSKNTMNSKFLFFQLYNSDIKKVLYSLGGGLRQTLRYEELKKFPLVVIPLEEQNSIVEYIENNNEMIDKTIVIEQRMIDLLKEYRQSLISEVVTGKIKVTTDE